MCARGGDLCVCVVYSRLFRTEDAKVEFHSVYVVFFPFFFGGGGGGWGGGRAWRRGKGKMLYPYFLSNWFFFQGALRPQKPEGLLGTGK